MHGRMKVRSSEEQERARKKEREAKAKHYRTVTERIYKKRDAGEKDNEVLQLTKEVLSANPEITTLWNYRREVLLEKKQIMSIEEFSELCGGELGLLESCLRVNPKAYCVWLHREWIMMNSSSPDWRREKSLCDLFLTYDERNFHCWDYRRFVISNSQCATSSEELTFTYDKIAANFSNYSAWHYRSKLLPVLYPSQENMGGVSEKALLKEYKLAQNAFFTDPDDQSAWFYHRWLLGEVAKPVQLDLVHVQLDPEPVLCAVFNHSIKLNLPLMVNVGEWSTSVKAVDWPSALYCCALPPITLDTVVLVSYGQQQVSVKANGWWRSREALAPPASTAATRTVLESELESCEQLLEEEPQNKWCLLTTMLLMQFLDPDKHFTEIRDKTHQLMTVDPYRKLYYNDLLSQFVIKNVLQECLSDHFQRTIDLSEKGLSRLDLAEYLVPYHTIVLSNNSLQSLPPFVLPCLQTLVLDGNSLDKLPPLCSEALRVLSIKNNNIGSLSSIEACLKRLPALVTLSLQGNPLNKEKGLIGRIKEMVPSLRELNGETI